MILFFKLYLTVHLYLYSIQDGQQCINVGKLISALEFGKTSIIFTSTHSLLFKTSYLSHKNACCSTILKKGCNQQVRNKILNIKSCIGQTSGSWGLLMCEYGRKSMIICEKKYWLPKADRSLKLLTLRAEIGWFHWNQGEKVTHFAWFGEPWHVHNLSGALSYNINFYYYWWNSFCKRYFNIHIFSYYIYVC